MRASLMKGWQAPAVASALAAAWAPVPAAGPEQVRARVLEQALVPWESVDRRCRTLQPQSLRQGFPRGAFDGSVSPEPPGTKLLGSKNG